MAPTHFQPAMSTGLASWNAEATATHGDQSCGSAQSAVSPLKYHLAFCLAFQTGMHHTR